MVDILLRFLIGGAVVSAFALIGDIVKPKSFAGLFGAAPSVALAVGGLITAMAGIIAKKFGPILGGLFLAFPAIFPASASLIEKHEKQKKEEKGLHGAMRGRQAASVDAAGAAMGSIGLLVFAWGVWRFLPKHNAVLVIALATVAWLCVAVGAWQVRKRV